MGSLRVLARSLVLTFAACLAGCGSGGGSDVYGATGPASPGERLRIGVSIPAADHGWTAGVVWWVERARKAMPDVEWAVATADRPEKQIADVETMLAKGIDGLVLLATESAPVTPVARKVKDAGVYLVNVDSGLIEPVADVFLEGDNVAFGRKAAEFIAERLGGQGRILVLEGVPSTVDNDRNAAFREALKAHPGIQILDSKPGKWDRKAALEVTQAMLLKHPKVDAIWAADDDMALGAEQALREAGRTRVWLVGGGGMKDVVKRVMERDPAFPATVTYPPSMVATGMFLAYSALRDGKAREKSAFMPRHLLIDVELVTPGNAERYYFPDSVY